MLGENQERLIAKRNAIKSKSLDLNNLKLQLENLQSLRLPNEKLNLSELRKKLHSRELARIHALSKCIFHISTNAINGVGKTRSETSIVKNMSNRKCLATSFGLISQFIMGIAKYLDIPLRYPVILNSSATLVLDPVTLTPSIHDFSILEGQGVEFAIFMINKNIEQVFRVV